MKKGGSVEGVQETGVQMRELELDRDGGGVLFWNWIEIREVFYSGIGQRWVRRFILELDRDAGGLFFEIKERN